MITKKDLDNVSKNVFEDINNLCFLPKDSLIAGGAVASLFFKHLKLPISAPINDIDIFLPTNNYNYEEEANFANSGYNFSRFLGSINDNYNITKTENIGLANYIYCSETKNLNEKIIKSFDINFIKIGIETNTQKLIVSQEFIDFCNNFNAKIVKTQTPVKSYIRYLKKSESCNGIKFDENKYEKYTNNFMLLVQRLLINDEINNNILIESYNNLSENIKSKLKVFEKDVISNKDNENLSKKSFYLNENHINYEFENFLIKNSNIPKNKKILLAFFFTNLYEFFENNDLEKINKLENALKEENAKLNLIKLFTNFELENNYLNNLLIEYCYNNSINEKSPEFEQFISKYNNLNKFKQLQFLLEKEHIENIDKYNFDIPNLISDKLNLIIKEVNLKNENNDFLFEIVRNLKSIDANNVLKINSILSKLNKNQREVCLEEIKKLNLDAYISIILFSNNKINKKTSDFIYNNFVDIRYLIKKREFNLGFDPLLNLLNSYNEKLLKDGGEDYIIKNTTDLLIDVFQSNDYNIKTMEDIYFNNNYFKKLIDVYNSNGKIENNIIKEKLKDLNIRIAMRDFSEKNTIVKKRKI